MLATYKSGLKPTRLEALISTLQRLSAMLYFSRRMKTVTITEEIKMRSWLRRFSLCLFTILLWSLLSTAAELESAKRAYEQKDYATARKEFAPLAEQGNADAQLFLGKMYLKGQGVLKDSDKAIKWFKASATQGNADAQFFLGSYYLLSHRDVSEGVKWMRLSAEQGNQDAQLLLGKAYLQGELPRDPVQADMWLRLAAKNNLPFYEAELSAAEKQMSPDQIGKGKALAEAWKPKIAAAPAAKTGARQEQKN
jgi:TPR repeat protein